LKLVSSETYESMPDPDPDKDVAPNQGPKLSTKQDLDTKKKSLDSHLCSCDPKTLNEKRTQRKPIPDRHSLCRRKQETIVTIVTGTLRYVNSYVNFKPIFRCTVKKRKTTYSLKNTIRVSIVFINKTVSQNINNIV
jgi:hypothetical protein